MDDTVLINVNNAVFGLFEAVSLLAGITSVILAVLAIWLSLHFKRDSDAINDQTKELLIEVRTESKYLSEVIMPELKAYGSSMRGVISQNVAIASEPTLYSTPQDFQVEISSNNSVES